MRFKACNKMDISSSAERRCTFEHLKPQAAKSVVPSTSQEDDTNGGYDEDENDEVWMIRV